MTNTKQDEQGAGKKLKFIKNLFGIFDDGRDLSLGINEREFRKLKHYEHELNNRRITWLLTSQSLLFAAYGLVFSSSGIPNGKEKVINVIPILGSIIAGLIFFGILASIIASCYLWWEVQQKYESEPLGVRNRTTLLSWFTDLSLPVVFLAAWILIMV